MEALAHVELIARTIPVKDLIILIGLVLALCWIIWDMSKIKG